MIRTNTVVQALVAEISVCVQVFRTLERGLRVDALAVPQARLESLLNVVELLEVEEEVAEVMHFDLGLFLEEAADKYGKV